MFSDNKKNQNSQDNFSTQNIIAKGAVITGDFISNGNIRVDGVVEGSIKTPGKVVVGKEGKIKGNLEAKDAYFEGGFSGVLTLSGTLTLKASAIVEGEVVLTKLAVEPGANFNVNCTMKNTVKDIKSGSKTKKTA